MRTAGLGFLRGAVIGAGLLYWLDPISGRRRRSTARQRLLRAADLVKRQTEVALRDVSHRTLGLLAHARRRIHPQAIDDVTLKARVQAGIGRTTSHPGSLQIACRNGRVELAGMVLKQEMPALVRAVRRVPGVDEVVNCLETRDEAAHMPRPPTSHRHPHARAGEARGWSLDRASPALRLLVALGGVGLFARGWGRGGWRGAVAEAAGAGLVGRSLSSPAIERFTALEGERRGVGLRKTINIDAPLEQVFALWSHPELFPRFMTHVREVRRIDDRRTRWRISGPARLDLEWDAEVTELEPNQLLAWRSAPDAALENAGRVRFTRNEHGGTRVDVQLSYHPPGGLLGHLLATLLGGGPKKLMDDDLVRLKSLIELGKATGRRGTVTLEEIDAQAHAAPAPG